MSSKQKRRRQTAQADEVEAWLRETEASLHGGDAGGAESQAAGTSAPRMPAWPPACRPLAEALCDGACGTGPASVDSGLAALRALRLSLSLGVGSRDWRAWAEQRLEDALCRPPVVTAASPDVKSYHSESRAARHAAGGAAVSLLRQLCALDRLGAVLWDMSRRGTGPPVHLPAAVAEAAAVAHLAACADGAATARRVLAAVPEVARAWGARDDWLARGEGEPWRDGACALLRLMRARWLECVCLTRRMEGVDPKRAEAAVLRWQLAGRDVGARFLSFAIPSREALRCLAGLAVAGGLVELGAHNGHWAACVDKRAAGLRRAADGGAGRASTSGSGLAETAGRKRGSVMSSREHSLGVENGSWPTKHSGRGAARGLMSQREPSSNVSPHPPVIALDISPPPPPPRQPLPVMAGTADSLPSLPQHTLFLCMPSPGEEGLAEAALAAFRGSHVAYVGEWGTGMTGTRELHTRLLSGEWEMQSRLPVPNWPLIHAELFVFTRASRGGKGGQVRGAALPAREQALVRCAGCGGQAVRRCPRTRQLCLCSSPGCFAATAGAHAALLELGFCGLAGVARPPWEEWDRCRWLGEETASKREWLALARATPHAEGGFGLNWSQP